jgi:hypothetical protein
VQAAPLALPHLQCLLEDRVRAAQRLQDGKPVTAGTGINSGTSDADYSCNIRLTPLMQGFGGFGVGNVLLALTRHRCM